MTDKDTLESALHGLRDIDTPEPSSAVKYHHIAQGTQAFDEALQKKNKKFSQGLVDWLRHTFATNKKENVMLKKKYVIGTALAGSCAYLLAWGVFNNTDLVQHLGTDNKAMKKAEPQMEIAQRSDNSEMVYDYSADGLIYSPDVKAPAKPSVSIASNKEKKSSKPAPAKAKPNIAKPDAPQKTLQMHLAETEAYQRRQKIKAMARANVANTESRSLTPAPVFEPVPQQTNNDKFEKTKPNALKITSTEPVSTFSIDVDTASYAYVRRSLNQGQLPNANQVRPEEMINYFDYDYDLPKAADAPFATDVTIMPTPWNEDTQLMHIGIQGYDLPATTKPRANIVLLVDVSGSMQAQDKLPLLKNAFRLMVESLDDEDMVSIVTYAGRAGTALEPTKAADKQAIFDALDNLQSGGSTAGQQGIKQAYALAEQHYDAEGVNRVMLATDGDFNVGMSNNEELKDYIAKKRESGVSLSVLGFGQGNYNDALMQTLAQNGNGNAAYIDTLSEARKVLVEEAGSTLFTIAKDVKIQVEFNPSRVAEYRLIGYESRMLNREDFNNDKIDAGEIGAGHTVTAMYEIIPTGSNARMTDELRYAEKKEAKVSDEIAHVKIRYKLPKSDTSTLISTPITDANVTDSPQQDTQFAAAVATFAQKLRGEPWVADYAYKDLIELALKGRGKDAFGYRSEFISLVRLAESLQGKE